MGRTFCFSERYLKIGIIGAGSYGTALAQCFAAAGHDVTLISRSEEISKTINENHTQEKALPSVILSEGIRSEIDYEALVDAEVIFITVPAKNVEEVCLKCGFERPFVLCSKGLDPYNGELLSDFMQKLGADFAILSGPSFAIEIARGEKAAVNIAGENPFVYELARKLSTPQFEIIPIKDYIGLQISGVFKNILAVGCGMLRELSGCSTIAKFVTQGIQEMALVTKKMSGDPNTFFEVGGIGDIFLTCTSTKSRNINFGSFCVNHNPKDWAGELAEGALSAKWIPLFEQKYHVELPFFHKIYAIIYENMDARRIMD